ncbi:transcriptional regulator domain-containing protein [Bradyrhizobium sp. Cp5.3]|uniref:transcriptional regulator domain-containing protein n=1 Tax=Bradyrhizobium sp. Cp5.3 TaxID=443598 RepID=UPI000A009BAA|nr:DUF6499 domain-containing protein [Bradyrhizobium sp. Cp5.3]
MSDFDWRSPETYQRAKAGDITDFAWECLRRSPAYQADYRDALSKDGQATPEFRRRWGVCFRS